MDINTNTLINKDILNTKKFDNVNVKNLEDKKLKEVCDNFESFFLKQVMDVSLKSSTIAGESAGSDIIKGMYTEAIASNSTGTFGISDMLYKFLTKENKIKKDLS